MGFLTIEKEGFTISTDPDRLDMDAICAFLARAYWAQNRPRAVTERAVRQSLCFGLYDGARQIGFTRVVTDYATFAWLCDVFVEEGYRGRGLGAWLVETTLSHPELQGLRRWLLATRDAQGLYRRFGFAEFAAPGRWMERLSG
jgi:GNAT superfamily N-acetyltransferase